MTTPNPNVPVISPARLFRYLTRKFAEDRHLQTVGVQGEVTNLRMLANGNWYFQLKDAEAVLNCVAWDSRTAQFPPIENGTEVTVYGEVKLYEKQSLVQLIVGNLKLSGIGELHRRFEELRRKLEAEGLFADARKRKLPEFPFTVALVGSPTADGTNDFLTQARERAPHVAIQLFPTAVNGVQAAPQIAAAIAHADGAGADLLVVVRGGGSYEDLFCFSDERVVRAIVAARTPTVAAIGHESDHPLIESVADLGASTPSKAAQTVLPQTAEIRTRVTRAQMELRSRAKRVGERCRLRLLDAQRRGKLDDVDRLLGSRRMEVDRAHRALERLEARTFERLRRRLDGLNQRIVRLNPRALFERRKANVQALGVALTQRRESILLERRRRVTMLSPHIDAVMRRIIEQRRARLEGLKIRLTAADPDALLHRGYAIVSVGAVPLRDPSDAPPGTIITARLARGTIKARVERESPDVGQQIGLF
jgi:exodeoxyribonuclease VII large subunit